MKKIYKIVALIIATCLLMICFSACSNTDSNSSIVDNSKSESNFNFPDKSDFSLSTNIENSNLKKGESFVINCCLKNNTERDFFIEHGVETITYSYNDVSECLNAISVLDTLNSSSEIKRKINIQAIESGVITVTATIRVKPAQYSDSYETYTYNQEINVTVEA